jgi:hypothetical protein
MKTIHIGNSESDLPLLRLASAVVGFAVVAHLPAFTVATYLLLLLY